MKKLLQSLFILMLVASAALAQDRTVTGTVTAKEDGLPLPGVSVKVKGTTTGTQTGADGKFSLKVTTASPVLQFSFIGYTRAELAVPASNSLNVALTSDSKMLSEVVVTALGETREKKALAYSVGEVSAEKLTIAKNTDISTALAGKVAGVQLVGSPSSTFGNANIIIRGINGLAPGSPLFVVDGTPTAQEDVIMDNVENISVLKGASAVALYGNRAANGVVIVTTKKGKRNTKPSVEVNLSTNFENLSLIPGYQNQYAGGYTSTMSHKNSYVPYGQVFDDAGFYIFKYDPVYSGHPASWAAFDNQRILEYGADESWGPKIGGQQYRTWSSWYPGSKFGQTSALVAQPDNIKDFFRTGRNQNNSIAFSGGGEGYNFRVTYQNQNRSLILENSKMDQHQFGINGAYDLSKKAKITTEFGYTHRSTTGTPQEGYRNDGLNVTQGFNQWFQRQLDLNELKDYKNADGTFKSWNIGDPNFTADPAAYLAPQYWDSPYMVMQNNYGTGKNNRLVGNIGLTYELAKNLTWQSNFRTSYAQGNSDFRIGTGGLEQDSYQLSSSTNSEMNYETNLMYKKSWKDLSFDALVGGNIRNNRYTDLFMATQGGLSVPNYFDITASIARPTTTRGYSARTVRSVYGRASLGYKGILYVDGSLRNDWSSALPTTSNNYLYPSIGSSFIFSELLKGGIKNVISFGKIRGSYAQVGSDLGFNQVNTAIARGSIYNDQASFAVGDQYRSGNVKPALTKSWEVGAEFKLFNKFGIDFSYYVDNNINQILSLDVSGSSGFTSNQINAGNIQRKGLEVAFTASPFKTKNFQWDMNLNFAKSESFVKELSSELKTYVYGTTWNDARLELREGQKWGMLVGRKWKTDANGNTTILTTGLPDYNINQDLGSIVPDFTGGFINTLRYKGFDLGFSIDFQSGGQFFSTTKMFNYGAGLSEFTVGTNEKGGDWRAYPGTYAIPAGGTYGSVGSGNVQTGVNAGQNGGILIPGLFANGLVNNRYVPARNYFYTALQRDSRNWILDGSYVKLRDIRFGYTIPTKWLGGSKYVKNANLGVIVSNALLLWAPAKKYGVDPSELEDFWNEGGQLSSTRTIGVNLKIGF